MCGFPAEQSKDISFRNLSVHLGLRFLHLINNPAIEENPVLMKNLALTFALGIGLLACGLSAHMWASANDRQNERAARQGKLQRGNRSAVGGDCKALKQQSHQLEQQERVLLREAKEKQDEAAALLQRAHQAEEARLALLHEGEGNHKARTNLEHEAQEKERERLEFHRQSNEKEHEHEELKRKADELEKQRDALASIGQRTQ